MNIYDAAYAGFDPERPYGMPRAHHDWHRRSQFEAAAAELMPGSVLDDGGGFGAFAPYVAGRCQYINCDVSGVMLASDPGDHPKVPVDGRTLPFPSERFDNVVSLGVLRHVEDPDVYLAEAVRVLRPGGVFVLSTVRAGYERELCRSWLWWVMALYRAQQVVQQIHRSFNPAALPTVNFVPFVSYEEDDVVARLGKLGLRVGLRRRFCKDLPGPIPWRLADLIVDEARYGKFMFIVARKET